MKQRRRVARAEGHILELIAEAQGRRLGTGSLSPWELPAVVACRRVIADTIMQLRLEQVKGDVPTPVQPALFRKPNPIEPGWLSFQRIVTNLTGWGYVWLEPTAFDAAGYPLSVRVREASHGSASFTPAGELAEVYLDGRRHVPGLGTTREAGVIWLPYDVPHAGSPGQSPIAGCWRAIEYLAALYEMCGSFWEAGFPSVAVTVAQTLSVEQAGLLKDQLIRKWARRHEPAVLDRGATIEPIGSSAVESQLVESIAMANAEIARAFGVMPSLVNVAGGDSLTYSTTAAEFSKWKIVGLGPYNVRIESAFSEMRPYGTEARFDTSVLTRADEATRGQYLNLALGGAPWLDVNEARRKYEGLGPKAPTGTPATTNPTNLELISA